MNSWKATEHGFEAIHIFNPLFVRKPVFKMGPATRDPQPAVSQPQSMSLSWGGSVHLMGVGHKVLGLLFRMLSFPGMPCLVRENWRPLTSSFCGNLEVNLPNPVQPPAWVQFADIIMSLGSLTSTKWVIPSSSHNLSCSKVSAPQKFYFWSYAFFLA